jgi:hypothetical protein
MILELYNHQFHFLLLFFQVIKIVIYFINSIFIINILRYFILFMFVESLYLKQLFI